VHRLWAGSKLLAVAMLSAALSINPSWTGDAIGAALVVVALRAARIPRGATPRLPRWFWLGIAINGVFALIGGGDPQIHAVGFTIGLGGISDWARFLVFGFVLAAAAAVVGWTTPLADVPPAARRLLAPLTLVRVPVDELVVAIALSVRCLPLLVDELRVLHAARRVRRPAAPRGLRNLVREAHDLLATALVTSTRRARDMAEAIDARGGVGPIPRPRVRLGRVDVVALTTVAIACAAIIAI
jgi:energy-coupling factor transporter transmembrane protein EcfT